MATKKKPNGAAAAAAPSGAAAVVGAFAELFAGLARAHGVYELFQKKVGGKKVQGRARTVREPVTAELWERHLRGEQGLGVVPVRDDAHAWFGAVDVDKYDLRLEDVERRCAELRLPLLPTRTKSGGVHLYVFGAEPLLADLLKQRLEEWAAAMGYGGAEVFPKQGKLLSEQDVGNWINMPYFNALTGATDRYAVHKGAQLSVEQFIERARALRITNEQLEALAPHEGEAFLEGPPCLQSLSLSGFPEGMRNNGMFAVGVYLKKRYPDDWAAHMHAYNSQFFKPPLGDAEMKQLQKQLARRDYNFTCDKPPIKQFCNRNLCRTREFGVGKGAEDWGVVIGEDVLKVTTDPPYWIISVNGVRMQLFGEHLMQQRHFVELCVNKIGFMPAMLPSDKWRAEVNRLLQSAQEVEAPPDADARGELRWYLQQFCTVYPQAELREELLAGKPFTEDGMTHFRAADFKRFLDSQHFRAFSGAKLFAQLRDFGVQHKQYWVGDQNLHVWCVQAFERNETTIPTKTVQRETGAM